MAVAINGRPQKCLDRLLRRPPRYESPGKQAAGGAEEFQVDQRRSVDIWLPPKASSNRTTRTLVK